MVIYIFISLIVVYFCNRFGMELRGRTLAVSKCLNLYRVHMKISLQALTFVVCRDEWIMVLENYDPWMIMYGHLISGPLLFCSLL